MAAEPVLHAGRPTTVTVDVSEPAPVALFLRRLGWDMRGPQRWPLGEAAGSGPVPVTLPDGLAPGCARLCEYAIYAELRPPGGRLVAAAAPVALVGDAAPEPDEPIGAAIDLDAAAVPRGGSVSGRLAEPAEEVEIGAELRVAHEAPRFLAAVTVAPAADGTFTATLPEDVPPSLADGEDRTVVWLVRAGPARRSFTVTDPDGSAAERRPALLTFLAQLARDPFAFR